MSSFVISNMFDGDNAVMTSLDISELVGSRHDKVKQSIKRLAAKGIIQLPPMGEVEQNQTLSPNKKVSIFVFSGDKAKRDSLVVVAQLSPEFTADIVDRWICLEQKNHTLTRELEYWQLKEVDDKRLGTIHGKGLAERKTTKKVNNEKISETLGKMQLSLSYGGEQ